MSPSFLSFYSSPSCPYLHPIPEIYWPCRAKPQVEIQTGARQRVGIETFYMFISAATITAITTDPPPSSWTQNFLPQ
jgi:hypothetical protein